MALETDRGTILGYLAAVPETDTAAKSYDLSTYSGVFLVLNYNGFINSDYIPITGLLTGTRCLSVRPTEAYYCTAQYSFTKPVGSFQGSFRFITTTKHSTSVSATITLYGVK